MIESFLQSVSVIDTEATSNDPNSAEIIELGVARYKHGSWEVNDTLFKPISSIKPACSAICNITDRMVEDKLSFKDSLELVFNLLDPTETKYYVAHNAVYDIAVLNSNFKQAGIDFDVERDLGKDHWICTFRLAKRLLASKANEVEYGQNFLRYYFGVNVDPSLSLHRAGNDSLICGHVLIALLELAIQEGLVDPDKEIGSQLSSLSWDSIPLKTWPYGKNKGKAFSELDDGFLKWAILNVNDLDEKSYSYDRDLAAAVEAEVNNRPRFKL